MNELIVYLPSTSNHGDCWRPHLIEELKGSTYYGVTPITLNPQGSKDHVLGTLQRHRTFIVSLEWILTNKQ